jgi:XTP/dITP diphosphohydrolase
MTFVYFASSNENKFLEIQSLYEMENRENNENVRILFSSPAIKEIQSDSMTEVAEDKAKKAFGSIKRPVIVEDDGLFIDELNGFPGVYSSFAFKTIGNKGILKLLANNEKRRARFLSVFSFFDGNTIETFCGETDGHIATEIFPSGWGFDPIFKPENEDLTYGELSILRKNEISHRSKAFRRFLKWCKLKYNHHDN